MIGLNIGSGQRRFDTSKGWVNIDCVSRPPDQVPDLVCDVGRDPLPYKDESVDVVVLHQVYEHFGLGEGHGVIREAYRVLKPHGRLIVTVPDMTELARAWLAGVGNGGISDYIYFVNVYGAYQGLPSDRHAWGYCYKTLWEDLDAAIRGLGRWARIGRHSDQPKVPGADIALDWWILDMEAVK